MMAELIYLGIHKMTYNEILENLGEAEIAMVSMLFWNNHDGYKTPLPKNIHDYPFHPIWDELKAFQMGWLMCKNEYKIND